MNTYRHIKLYFIILLRSSRPGMLHVLPVASQNHVCCIHGLIAACRCGNDCQNHASLEKISVPDMIPGVVASLPYNILVGLVFSQIRTGPSNRKVGPDPGTPLFLVGVMMTRYAILDSRIYGANSSFACFTRRELLTSPQKSYQKCANYCE